jgi:hypothetical protein
LRVGIIHRNAVGFRVDSNEVALMPEWASLPSLGLVCKGHCSAEAAAVDFDSCESYRTLPR